MVVGMTVVEVAAQTLLVHVCDVMNVVVVLALVVVKLALHPPT